MGLDMYLEAERSVCEAALAKWIGALVPDAPGVVSKVRVTVGYWRKANAIHRWFVKNVQEGVDRNGEETPVSRAQLQTLLETCKAVQQQPTRAGELLPTQAGFFFGETKYDENYWNSVKQTVAILVALKLQGEAHSEWNFMYRSWW